MITLAVYLMTVGVGEGWSPVQIHFKLSGKGASAHLVRMNVILAICNSYFQHGR